MAGRGSGNFGQISKLRAYKYDKNANRFKTIDPTMQPSVQKDNLSFVTLNVWFENFEQHQRVAAQIQYLKSTEADVICLQESAVI
jgi:hypothetical protein